MNFSEALRLAKDGLRIRRAHWEEGTFVVQMEGMELPSFNTQNTDRKVNDRTAKFIGKNARMICNAYFAHCLLVDNVAFWTPGWLPDSHALYDDNWEIFNG